MQPLREFSSGLLLGILSTAIVLGGFLLSMNESGQAVVEPTATLEMVTATEFPTEPPITKTAQVTKTTLAEETATGTPEPSPTATVTAPPPPTSCPPPAGWIAILVQPYDTLASLALTYKVTAAEIMQANCLVSDQLVTNSYVYVPLPPSATTVACGAPAGWVNYLVQPGDTLFRISLLYRVSVNDLKRANCLVSDTIKSGTLLKVPNVATSTPQFVPSLTPTNTLEPSVTSSPTTELPSPTATNTTVPSETPTTPPPPPTATIEPTATTAPQQ